MLRVGVFTIASKNYIAHVRTLMASLEKHHPEYRRYLCLADEVEGYFAKAGENFEVIEANTLGIESFQDMSIRYGIMEFNTAIKPFMIEWIFNNTELDCVIYLDPDIEVFSRFDVLESEFQEGASVVLTPHITEPLEDQRKPDDHNMIQSGVFNLGFIAVRRCDEAIRFVQWWGRRLTTQGASDLANNLFTDQRWCDLAPCFLDRLKVLKNPGFNVAYWNLAQRQINQSDSGKWFVDSQPLVFFHFSGLNADQPTIVSKHQDRLNWDDIASCHSLFVDYSRALVGAGWHSCKDWPYAYAHTGSELATAYVMRQLYRAKEPQPVDRFKLDDAAAHLIGLCNAPAQGVPQKTGVVITELMHFIYRSRPDDLLAAFNLTTADGQKAFEHWFQVSGMRAYGLPRQVVLRSSTAGVDAFRLWRKIIGAAVWALGASVPLARWIGEHLPKKLREKCKIVWRRIENGLNRRL